MKTTSELLRQYDLLPRGAHILCALSGGRDSVYLLHRLLEWAGERELRISAAHYNHCLRGIESERDEQFVRTLCRQLRVPLYCGSGDVKAYAAGNGLGIEEAARTLRYAFLAETADAIGAHRIATAHHADDLAETMLLNLIRGAGTKGLSGIPPRRGNIVRPILLVTRAEIDDYLAQRQIAYVEDSTNGLEDCTRNVIRHRVLPELAALNPGFVRHAAEAALRLRCDDEVLSGQAERFLREHPLESGIPVQQLLQLPEPVSGRVIRLAFGESLQSVHVEGVLSLCKGEGLHYLSVPGVRVRLDRERLWRDQQAPAYREFTLTGDSGKGRFGPTEVTWEKGVQGPEIHNSLNTFCLKCENMKGAVVVGGKHDGDRIKLQGKPHTKRIKQLFQEAKLTQPQRIAAVVVRDEAGPLALQGFGAAERCKPEFGDEILIIRCKDYKKNGD